MKSSSLRPFSAGSEAVQSRFALRVAACLSENTASLGPDLGERLRFARERALQSSRSARQAAAAPSPAGWPDRAEEWLGPDAVWKRVEWATRVADRWGRQLDARQLAQASLGPLLQDNTVQQISRAADGPQALALLLLSPEFQRR